MNKYPRCHIIQSNHSYKTIVYKTKSKPDREYPSRGTSVFNLFYDIKKSLLIELILHSLKKMGP